MLKYIVLILMLEGVCSFSANSANTYSYLWITTNNASGSINYTGPSTGLITSHINSLYTGTMKLSYISCSTTAQKNVYYRADDRWLFVPKFVSVKGKNITISINTLPSGYSISAEDNNEYIIKQEGQIINSTVYGGCGKVGNTYAINYTYPSFLLDMDVSDLSAGIYTGVIPVRIAYAEYYGVYPTDITKFSNDLASQHTTNTNVPYSIIITNKCTVSPTEISLNHGELSVDVAEGHSVSQNVSIDCDEAASLKVSVSSRKEPRTLYSDGVGVGLGNGWDSVLQIGNSGLSDYSLTDKAVSVSEGGNSMQITSMLRKNGTVSAGNISGSMVFSVTLD